jgi:xanthine/CO dehydrogenase XdhC/CoxF family maturation factor
MPVQTRVLICGAGPDAVPVAEILAGLGWQVVLIDHRPAFARQERFPESCQVVLARPKEMAGRLDLDDIDAAVVMSHHLENDALYLRQLAAHNISYLGVLGPAARRKRLCEMAACGAKKIYGPVGLDIGAELPESIALSLAAEIHAVLNDRNGVSLTRR